MASYRTANKWLDRTHPQTLYMANLLLYINAAFWLLDMLLGEYFAGALAVAAIFAGLGLANEKKAGYYGAVGVAGLNLLFLLTLFWYGGFASVSLVINVIFAIALMALLLHPMTRNYERIWFKRLNGR
jgi:hypothetical protein